MTPTKANFNKPTQQHPSMYRPNTRSKRDPSKGHNAPSHDTYLSDSLRKHTDLQQRRANTALSQSKTYPWNVCGQSDTRDFRARATFPHFVSRVIFVVIVWQWGDSYRGLFVSGPWWLCKCGVLGSKFVKWKMTIARFVGWSIRNWSCELELKYLSGCPKLWPFLRCA